MGETGRLGKSEMAMATTAGSSRGIYAARVVERVELCREHFRLRFAVPGLPASGPGQFLQVQCNGDVTARRGVQAGGEDSLGSDAGEGHEFDWDPSAGPMRRAGRAEASGRAGASGRLDPSDGLGRLGQTVGGSGSLGGLGGVGLGGSMGLDFDGPAAFLRRPFSIAGRMELDGVSHVDLIGREVGVGTRFLSRLGVGDEVSVLGPLGNRFRLPGANGIGLLVGGGVGIPPMIYLAQAIAELNRLEAGERPRRAIAFSGALTVDLLALTRTGNAPRPGPTDFDPRYNIGEFDAFGVPAVISTDDGSWGWKGFVTEALERYLDAWITDQADRQRAIIYTCGPEPMMKRVQEIAARRGIACQIAVERAMACGMGTCQSCCIRVKKPDPARPPMPGESWCYRLACTDGPVFSGDDLLW